MSADAKLVTIAMLATVGCFTKPGRPDELVIDAPAAVPLAIVGEAHGNNMAAATMTLMLKIPPGPSRFLITSVQLGGNCGDLAAPSVREVRAGTTLLTQHARVVGTPCGSFSARSEQWSLLQPPVGDTVPITFELDTAPLSMHATALVLDGVDQTTPIREFQTEAGTGVDSTLTINSAVGDLVIDTIGAGSPLTGSGVGQDRVFTKNESSSNTLNNSSASSKLGDAFVTMTWTIGAPDEYQTIAASIQPASPP